MKHSLRHGAILYALLSSILLLSARSALGEETVIYYHNDALGSPVAATDENGQVVWREDYKPYGERIRKEAASGSETQWYTGKPEETGLGVQYFNARWYDPSLGRFLAIDPAAVNPEDHRTFNRYGYAFSNPYLYVDPDGRESRENVLKELGDSDSRRPLTNAAGAVGRGASGIGSAVDEEATNPINWMGGFLVGKAVSKGLGNQNPLYRAAVDKFKNSDLSNAGRALTKHPEVIGETKDTLRQSLRTDAAVNDAAHAALRDIMRNGVTTNPTLGRYGTVTQVQVPGGFGARWTSDGSFIGFINP